MDPSSDSVERIRSVESLVPRDTAVAADGSALRSASEKYFTSSPGETDALRA